MRWGAGSAAVALAVILLQPDRSYLNLDIRQTCPASDLAIRALWPWLAGTGRCRPSESFSESYAPSCALEIASSSNGISPMLGP